MSWIAHKSSQVHSSRYDPVEQAMDVRYVCKCGGKGTNGVGSCPSCNGMGYSSEYRYHNVPAEINSMITNADSVGGMLNKLLKRGEHKHPPEPFKFTRVK